MADQALDRPGRRIAERADRVAFDLLRHLEQHVDLARLGACPRPCASSPATSSRCLRGTACTGRSFRACRNCDSRAIALIMSVDLSMTMTAAVPRPRLAACAASRNPSARRRSCAFGITGTDEPPGITASRLSQPPRTPPACLLDQLAQRNADIASSTLHGLLTWPEMQNTLVPEFFGRPKLGEPRRAAPQDRRRHRDAFDVVDRGRAAVEPDGGRERRLQPRHALLAFEALEQRRLFAADVGAGAAMEVEVERPSRGRCPCRSARPRRPRRSPPAAACARCRIRRECRCRRRARPSRSRRPGSLRPACADRGA